MTAIPARYARHRVRRLGLPRPPCGARAGQARLPHPRRGAPARARRPSAAARPGRPDPCGAGQPALSGLGRGGRARRRRRDQPGRHPVRARPAAIRRGAGVGAEAVALAAAAYGARLVHVSAIGADERSPSHYARVKATGEKLVLAAVPSAVILRPSIVFGPEDDFFNKFAAMARISPALPLIGGGHTRFQPVFAGDVAQAVVAAHRRAGAGRPQSTSSAGRRCAASRS